MIRIFSVVGARPNFIKIAPVHKVFQRYPEVQHKICHTGQHFDKKMSQIFFDELDMPKPDYYLGVSGGSHADQTARIMIEFEKVLIEEKPDVILVPGDVNSTMACSLVASKMGIKIGHVESGLRSFDREMPEEINRIVTDSLSDYLFVSEPSGIKHLLHEGIPGEKIHFTGNVMIDSLISYLPKIEKSEILTELKQERNSYTLVTFHRPRNVDNPESLQHLVEFLNDIGNFNEVVFPVHPRTRNNLENYHLLNKFSDNIFLTEPIGYLDFLKLVKEAKLVITDSGGIQEETTYLGVQCITVRNNTERPVTVEEGTNQLAGTQLDKVSKVAVSVLEGKIKKGKIPEKWDGHAAERIVDIIVHDFRK